MLFSRINATLRHNIFATGKRLQVRCRIENLGSIKRVCRPLHYEAPLITSNLLCKNTFRISVAQRNKEARGVAPYMIAKGRMPSAAKFSLTEFEKISLESAPYFLK